MSDQSSESAKVAARDALLAEQAAKLTEQAAKLTEQAAEIAALKEQVAELLAKLNQNSSRKSNRTSAANRLGASHCPSICRASMSWCYRTR